MIGSNLMHVHQNPNQTWSFVGRVSLDAYYDTDRLSAPDLKRLRDAAELGMADMVRGRMGVKARVWPSREEALAWAAERGLEVAP